MPKTSLYRACVNLTNHSPSINIYPGLREFQRVLLDIISVKPYKPSINHVEDQKSKDLHQKSKDINRQFNADYVCPRLWFKSLNKLTWLTWPLDVFLHALKSAPESDAKRLIFQAFNNWVAELIQKKVVFVDNNNKFSPGDLLLSVIQFPEVSRVQLWPFQKSYTVPGMQKQIIFEKSRPSTMYHHVSNGTLYLFKTVPKDQLGSIAAVGLDPNAKKVIQHLIPKNESMMEADKGKQFLSPTLAGTVLFAEYVHDPVTIVVTVRDDDGIRLYCRGEDELYTIDRILPQNIFVVHDKVQFRDKDGEVKYKAVNPFEACKDIFIQNLIQFDFKEPSELGRRCFEPIKNHKPNSTTRRVGGASSKKVKGSMGRVGMEEAPAVVFNVTPKEILRLGAFGGTYFRPIQSGVLGKRIDGAWKELPPSWLKGLDVPKVVCSSEYDTSVNLYKVRCGSSLEAWEKAGWIRAQDPYGWFQWYCRYCRGRRSPDDARQLARAAGIMGPKGRFRVRLCNLIRRAAEKRGVPLSAVVDDPTISPVIRQTLLHWGYRVTLKDVKAT